MKELELKTTFIPTNILDKHPPKLRPQGSTVGSKFPYSHMLTAMGKIKQRVFLQPTHPIWETLEALE